MWCFYTSESGQADVAIRAVTELPQADSPTTSSQAAGSPRVTHRWAWRRFVVRSLVCVSDSCQCTSNKGVSLQKLLSSHLFSCCLYLSIDLSISVSISISISIYLSIALSLSLSIPMMPYLSHTLLSFELLLYPAGRLL